MDTSRDKYVELNFIILSLGDTVINLQGCHRGQGRKDQSTKREQCPLDTFASFFIINGNLDTAAGNWRKGVLGRLEN